MSADMRWFAGRIADAQLREADLERRTDNADTPDHGLLLELIEELRTSHEELRVADEELRAQADEISGARALAEAAASWWEDVIAAARTSDPDGRLRDQLRRGTGLLTEMAQTLMQQATDTVRLERLVSQLQTALDSRIAIEQAKGKLAERLSCSPQDAFELLRRCARTNNLRLHEFAARFVSGDTDLPATPPPE